MKSLNNFFLKKYQFTLRAVDEVQLKGYNGSRFRGVFGRELKKGSPCSGRDEDCLQCVDARRCSYFHIFKPKSDRNVPWMKLFNEFPRPYIISAPFNKPIILEEGDFFHFDLTLVGDANARLPQIIETFERIGNRGLDKRGTQRYVLCRVESIDIRGNKKPVYEEGAYGGLGDVINFRSLSKDNKNGTSINTVSLVFVTPLRMFVNSSLLRSAPEFSTLFKTLVTKTLLLSFAYCGGKEDPAANHQIEKNIETIYSKEPRTMKGQSALRKMLHDAESISIHKPFSEDNPMSKRQLTRYSSRLERFLKQDGLIGKVTYTGEQLGRFLPYLKLGELIHIGKDSTFGHGKYYIE